MIGGLPLSVQAIGDTGRREIPGEWGGPALDAARIAARLVRPKKRADRRVTVRKP